MHSIPKKRKHIAHATVQLQVIGDGFLLPLAFRFGVNGLNAPAEVGWLSGVLALFQGDLEFPPGFAVPIQVPVAAGQRQGGDRGASFAGAAEELDRPVIHPAEGVPFSESCQGEQGRRRPAAAWPALRRPEAQRLDGRRRG